MLHLCTRPAALLLLLPLGLGCGDRGHAAAPTAAATPAATAAAGGGRTPHPGFLSTSGVRRDVPYVATPMEVVDAMLDLAGVGADDLVYDLGSGDGRIVVRAAQLRGARGLGVDIDPARIAEAEENARRAGVAERVRFLQGDLFELDLRPATAVTLYLLPTVNLQLRPRLLEQLAPGTPVVSHEFHMDEWEADEHVRLGASDVYLWIVPARVAGTWRCETPEGERTLELTQEFQRVRGTLGGVGLTVPRLSGRELGFAVDLGGRVERYRGTVEGDAIRGTVATPGGTRPWHARRVR